jgi:DNA polymerase
VDLIEQAPANLAALGAGVEACRRCELWRGATHGVAGEGPARAPMMLVGEQPGDQEDLAGRPFVGPAGRILDKAMAEAGVAREGAYVTNAVKHFKYELRGKRRLHKTPDRGEIVACRWWLQAERALVKPRVVVAMGATAARSVIGRATPVMASRGKTLTLEGGGAGVVTIHPSFVLRAPDARAKAEAYAGFVADLRRAGALLD